jgi:hypothetical protein
MRSNGALWSLSLGLASAAVFNKSGVVGLIGSAVSIVVTVASFMFGPRNAHGTSDACEHSTTPKSGAPGTSDNHQITPGRTAVLTEAPIIPVTITTQDLLTLSALIVGMPLILEPTTLRFLAIPSTFLGPAATSWITFGTTSILFSQLYKRFGFFCNTQD